MKINDITLPSESAIDDAINTIEQVRRGLNNGRGCDHEIEKLHRAIKTLKDYKKQDVIVEVK